MGESAVSLAAIVGSGCRLLFVCAWQRDLKSIEGFAVAPYCSCRDCRLCSPSAICKPLTS